ncbi:MAG: epoxide hydrolase family protein [Chakrabartia sp.]
MSDAVTPFILNTPESALEDLHRRIDHARWPEAELVDDWSQGAPLHKVRTLVDHWRHHYDWRRCEARLNALGQFRTEIDGLGIHFLHIRSPHPEALPLIITHGWPGSVLEFMKIIGPLTDPVAHGGRAEDAFHLVLPSLPGFGFSDKPKETGWGIERIARAWAVLMARLGYTRWAAQGGDWGSAVTSAIGEQAPEGCIGIHVNMPMARPTPEEMHSPSPREMQAFMALKHYQDWDSGYSKQQSTRPQTLGYALADSAVGQAAWVYEKMWSWTDNQGAPEDALTLDEMIDNIMLYWLPGNATSSARLYWESFGSFAPKEIHVPTGVSIFPKEIMRPTRKWAEAVMHNIVHWNDLDKGGHFAAWEQPDLYVQEIRACFAKMR